jgi:hypothetical protein
MQFSSWMLIVVLRILNTYVLVFVWCLWSAQSDLMTPLMVYNLWLNQVYFLVIQLIFNL